MASKGGQLVQAGLMHYAGAVPDLVPRVFAGVHLPH